MALFRKLFYRKPPDGLLEISERVYVFDCCFTTDAWEAEEYKVYVGGVIGQLRDHYPDASILVFNFRELGTPSQIANALSDYDMTIMDYPRHYEGCPLLPMEVIHHFLRSGESWLSLGQQNVLLMHCERGGWPVMAFMLAALLIYGKQYSSEQKTLDMVYKQAPRELLHFLSPLNPIPSQLRYLQYVSRRNVSTEWPPLDRALTLDCIIIRMIPDFDGKGGCRPIFRIYGQDPFLASDRNSKLLFSTPKRSKAVRHYKQAECELVKIDINCHIQGDVVLECINLHDDMEREGMILRVMFNTSFIRSNILMLNRNDVDMLWDAKDQFPKDFRAEVLFSEMDSAASIVPVDLSCFEEKEGLPVEAFAKVQEIFNSVDWLVPKTDAALDVIQQITASNNVQEGSDAGTHKAVDPSTLLLHIIPEKHQDKLSIVAEENNSKSPIHLALEKQSVASFRQSQVEDITEDKAEPNSSMGFRTEPISLSPPSPRLSSSISATESISSPHPQSLPEKPQHLSTSESMHPSVLEKPEIDIHKGSQSLLARQTATETLPVQVSKDLDESSRPYPEGLVIDPSSRPIPRLANEENFSSRTKSSPPPPPPPLPVKDTAVSTGRSPSPPPPHTPQAPETPPLKDSTSRIQKSPPISPPKLNISRHPLKDKSDTRTGSPPAPSPSHTDSPPPPPPPPPPPHPPQTKTLLPNPLKSDDGTKIGPPPPPPPPPPLPSVSASREDQAVTAKVAPPPPPPPTPPLKETSALKDRPPPPPPPPVIAQMANSTSVPQPPPPPVPSSSSNSSNVPSAPPPPPFMGAGKPQSLPPPSAPPSAAKGRGLARTSTSRNNQTKKLKPLHWLKLTRAVQGSLWAEAQKSGEASKAPEIDISELESLFSAAVPNSSKGGIGGKTNSRAPAVNKPEKVQLIDHRRAYNCEIMLSKVKIPLHELMNSVLALEDSALDADQVDNLIKFCPTKDEMELLKNYKGEKDKLGKCEQFFLELMQVPRTESKLRVFSFKIQFNSQVSDLRNSLDVVYSTAEQIRNSAKLKKVMQTILSLGNALNQGTARGSAVGFRLDSLLKLTETRARNNKMTLMHYLCKVLADKLPELLDFSKDLHSLEPSSKIQLKFLAEEMQAINKGLEKVVQELSSSESDGPVSEDFRKALKEFLCFAEGEVRSLASLYSVVGRNVDSLILYFGEDPSRCQFEQVVSTLLNFVRTFNKAHEENCKQLEFDKKKAEKEAASSQTNMNTLVTT